MKKREALRLLKKGWADYDTLTPEELSAIDAVMLPMEAAYYTTARVGGVDKEVAEGMLKHAAVIRYVVNNELSKLEAEPCTAEVVTATPQLGVVVPEFVREAVRKLDNPRQARMLLKLLQVSKCVGPYMTRGQLDGLIQQVKEHCPYCEDGTEPEWIGALTRVCGHCGGSERLAGGEIKSVADLRATVAFLDSDAPSLNLRASAVAELLGIEDDRGKYKPEG